MRCRQEEVAMFIKQRFVKRDKSLPSVIAHIRASNGWIKLLEPGFYHKYHGIDLIDFLFQFGKRDRSSLWLFDERRRN